MRKDVEKAAFSAISSKTRLKGRRISGKKKGEKQENIFSHFGGMCTWKIKSANTKLKKYKLDKCLKNENSTTLRKDQGNLGMPSEKNSHVTVADF